MFFFVVLLFVGIVIAGAVYSNYLARKRREAFAEVAARLGLDYRSTNDYSLDEQYSFLKKLTQGSNRYAYNILHGTYQGNRVALFDYHYETYSTDSKGRRKTTHHHFSFVILYVPANFPELVITHESWLSKIAQFVGYDDIDFESAEFSRRFCVRSPDKKFAYDVCNARMIEFLLQNSDLDIEIERSCITLFFASRLKPEEIEFNLNRAVRMRQLLPDYLFN